MAGNSSKHGKKEFDRGYFRRFFEKYDKRESEMYYRWALGWVRFLDRYESLRRGKGKRVLEIGSSAGYFSKVLRERGFDVIASDISPYIIKKAKRMQPGLKFSKVDVQKKIGVAGSFDFIVAFEVLEHLEDPEKALRNIYGKLKKSGILIFSTPFPTKRSLADSTHINVHEEKWWLALGKRTGFKRRRLVHATFVPYLYRLNSVFSIGFPLKSDIPFVNSTAFFIFSKA